MGRKKKDPSDYFTPKIREKVEELYESTQNISKTAKAVDKPYSAVRTYLINVGLHQVVANRRRSSAEETSEKVIQKLQGELDDIVKLYQTEALSQVATKYRVHPSVLIRLFEEEGIELYTRDNPRPRQE